MMTELNDGGFAFPSPEWSDAHGNIAPQEYGMSLRDYFAAKAMPALITGRSWSHFTGTDAELVKKWATSSYAVADEMLKAREQKGGA